MHNIHLNMSLSAARCIFRKAFLKTSTNPASINVVTFTTLQYHKVPLKCFYTNFAVMLGKTTNFTSKRYVNISATLKMSKNYYDVLGVSRNANQKQIKDAYYKLAMKHHPDKNQGKLTQQFREIKEAYDVLGNESGRIKYNSTTHGSSNNTYSNTSSNWTSNSSYDRYRSRDEYTWTNARTEYKRAKRYNYDYSNLKPYNVFINVIKVPKDIVKTQIDIVFLTFIRNRTLKLILFQLFQFIWTQILKNVNFNVLISSNSSSNNSLVEIIKSIVGTQTVRIELSEIEALKGKAVRVHVNDNEKVLIVNIPRGVKRDQSFFLFYLVDDDKNSKYYKA